MNLLIVEPEIRGHFLSLYVRSIIKFFKTKKKIYLLTSKKIYKSNVLKVLVKENPNIKIIISKDIRYPNMKNPLMLIIYQLVNFLRIRKSIFKYNKKLNFDHIFFTNLDHFDKVLCFFKNPFQFIKFSGILVNPRVHQFYNKNAINFKFKIYKFFLSLLTSNNYLIKIFSNDILFYNFSRRKLNKKKIVYFNEPIIFNKKNKKSKNVFFKKNSLKILVYGAIRCSKSFEELIDLVKKIQSKINVHIIVAGQHELEVKKFLNKKNLLKNKVYKNFTIINRFIYPDEEQNLFLSTDLVWCVYKNTPLGSSGVFHLSCNYLKPVITNKEGLIGWYNNKYKLGPILNFQDENDYLISSKKLIELFNNKKKYNQFYSNQQKLLKIFRKQKKLGQMVKDFVT